MQINFTEPTADQTRTADESWVFLFPQKDLNDGGHLAQRRFFDICTSQRKTLLASYKRVEANMPYLDDLLTTCLPEFDTRTYCIHYGPHVSHLSKKLRGRKVIYFAHSTGWKISLPTTTPIVCVSKNTLGYWGKTAPNNPLFYLPNLLEDHFDLPLGKDCIDNLGSRFTDFPNRIHDVTIVARKMSPYLLDTLAPALAQQCKVNVIDYWVNNLAAELKQSKVFLYDSVNHWSDKKVSEGFGLPPLEAMACGCTVFSSVNDALAEYLEPNFNCHQIGAKGLETDIQQILHCLTQWQAPTTSFDLINNYRRANVASKMNRIAKNLCDKNPV